MRMFCLAGWANAEKVQPVVHDPVARTTGHFFGQVAKAEPFGINYGLAYGADDVGMGFGVVSVVAAASVTQVEFQDLADFFEQSHGFVNRCKASGRKITFDAGKDLLNARMSFTGSKNS